MYKLPSLQVLKIFAHTAGCNSFTKAGNELGLSQGAISQHIKNLEIRVGFKVFHRQGRHISLTASGRELLTSVTYNLNQIQRTIELEKLKENENELILSVFPGFAIRWLLPRLLSFNEAYPTLKVILNTVARPLDFNMYAAHAAIAYGPTSLFPETEKPLFTEYLFPVCAQSFAKQHGLVLPIEKEKCRILTSLPLLSDESATLPSFGDTWDYWHSCFELPYLKKSAPRQSHANITLQLAELGHGIAMGRTSLVMDALKTARLIPMTYETIVNPCQYYPVYNPVMPQNEALQIFIGWLRNLCLDIETFDPRNPI